jgi:hypothetical protein
LGALKADRQGIAIHVRYDRRVEIGAHFLALRDHLLGSLATTSEYAVVRASALLRQLLTDKLVLVHRANTGNKPRVGR